MLIVGGGLIGSELAMDFVAAVKAVPLVDNAASILAALMPPEVSSRLQHRLTDMGVPPAVKSRLQSLRKPAPVFVPRSAIIAALKWMRWLPPPVCARKPALACRAVD